MGMGEPLTSYDRTWRAVERLHDDVGLSARSITVSNVGVVPGILRMAQERLPVNLAVSLDAVELAAYARPLPAHVNLIPLTRHPGYPPAAVHRPGWRYS